MIRSACPTGCERGDGYPSRILIPRVNPHQLRDLAEIYRRRGHPERAVPILQAILYDENSMPHYYLALALLDAGNLPDALNHARTALDLSPEDSTRRLVEDITSALDSDMSRTAQKDPGTPDTDCADL